MGADRALRVAVQESVDPWGVACLLAAVVRNEQPNLVLMGKQAIDDDSNQASQFLAAVLNWPQATFASKIELDFGATPTTARIARETDSGIETLRVNLPAVISVDLRLNEPRTHRCRVLSRRVKKKLSRFHQTNWVLRYSRAFKFCIWKRPLPNGHVFESRTSRNLSAGCEPKQKSYNLQSNCCHPCGTRRC